MRIAIASKGDPFDLKTWSGIPAHICAYLQGGGHTVYNIDLKYPKEPWHYNWYRRYYHRLFKKWFLSDVEPFVLKQIARQFDREVEEIQPDLVLVIHGDFLAYTTFIQPAIIVHDATFASLLDYYPAFTNLTKRSIHAGNQMYQLALDRADAAVYASEWASLSARSDYGKSADTTHTIPFGANLCPAPDSNNVMEWIKNRSEGDFCNFLFLGVDWERKGGPDALKFVVELNRRGIESRLLIAGCAPTIIAQHQKFVENFGFLRKDIKEEADKLEQLLINSHALLLPSIAECYGCVYCEANAYGLPAIGRDTGGVPEIIKDNLNGLLMGTGETPEMLADRWAEIWLNRKIYRKISQTSLQEYASRLNYEVFVRKLEAILFKVVYKENNVLKSLV